MRDIKLTPCMNLLIFKVKFLIALRARCTANSRLRDIEELYKMHTYWNEILRIHHAIAISYYKCSAQVQYNHRRYLEFNVNISK